MIQTTVYLAKHSVSSWLNCVVRIEYSRNPITSSQLIVLLQSFICLLIFVSNCSINYWWMSVKICDYNCGFVYSHCRLSIIVYIFWNFHFRCINVKCCYAPLKNWHLYHLKWPSLFMAIFFISNLFLY